LPPTFRAARALVPTFAPPDRADVPRCVVDLPDRDDDDADDDGRPAVARADVRRFDVADFDDFDDLDLDAADFDAPPERFAVVLVLPEDRGREADDLPRDLPVVFLPDLPADLPPDLRDAMSNSFVRAHPPLVKFKVAFAARL